MQQSIVKFYCFVVQILLNMFRALQCPSSVARQTAVAASGFRTKVEVEVFSAVVGLLILCPSSGARQTAVAASGFRMNVEVEVFSGVVGLLVNKPSGVTVTHLTTSTTVFLYRGPGSSVGIATELRAGRSGDRIPVGARLSAPVQTGPGAHPASCTMGTGSFPGVKSGHSVTLTPHPLLVPWSWKSRAIPLLPLWAVRPVHSLSACTRVHFTFFLFTYSCIKK